MPAFETPEKREAREALESFKAGKVDLYQMLKAQPAGFKFSHQGKQYLSSIDGPRVLSSVPVEGIEGTYRQTYRNPGKITQYRESIQRARQEGKSPFHYVEPITAEQENGTWYMSDGHHRVDAAKAEGISEVPAWTPMKSPSLLKLAEKLGKAKRAKPLDPEGVPEYMPKVDTNSANLPPEPSKVKPNSYRNRPIPELVHEPEELRGMMIDRLASAGVRPPIHPRDPLGEMTAQHPNGPKELKSLHTVAANLYHSLRQGRSIEQTIKANKLSKEQGDALRLAGFVLGGTDHATYFLANEKDSGKQWYTKQLEKYVDGIRRIATDRWGFSPEVFGIPGSGFGKKELTPAMKAYMALTAVTSSGADPVTNSGLAFRIFDTAVKHAKQYGDSPLGAFHRLPLKQDDGRSWTYRGEATSSALTYMRNLFLPRGNEDHHKALERATKFLDQEHAPEYIHAVKSWLHNRPGVKVQANTPYGEHAHPGSYIFGPKLGSFYQNITGDLDHLTADLWWSRTWGRLVGRMFKPGKPGSSGLKSAPEEKEREVMDRAARVAAKSLDMTVANFQAVLWYYEKALYESMGGPADRMSYEKGIKHVNKIAGIPEEEDYPLFRGHEGAGGPPSPVRKDAKSNQGTSGHPFGPSLRALLRKARTVSFASPNVEQLDFEQALNRLRSENHHSFRTAAAQLLNRLQVKGKIEDAIGDWEDGAENSLVHDINVPNADLSRYIAAWMGRLGHQKSVLHFLPHKGGKDFLYQTDVPQTDLASLRGQLTNLGIQYRTLVPQAKGTKVMLFDEGGQLRDRFKHFAETNGGQVHELTGTGEFIGGPDRETAAAKYREVIGQYESAYGQSPAGGSAGDNPSGPRQAPEGGIVHRGQYYKGGSLIPKPGT